MAPNNWYASGRGLGFVRRNGDHSGPSVSGPWLLDSTVARQTSPLASGMNSPLQQNRIHNHQESLTTPTISRTRSFDAAVRGWIQPALGDFDPQLSTEPPRLIVSHSIAETPFHCDAVQAVSTHASRSIDPGLSVDNVPLRDVKKWAGPQRESKEKQQRIAHQSSSAAAEQRPNRCLRCRLSSRHRGCFNYSACDGCSSNYLNSSPLSHTAHQPVDQFLDWCFWLVVCQQLIEISVGSPLINSPFTAANNALWTFSEAIVLEFLYYDRTQVNACSTHVVTFQPCLQALRGRSDDVKSDIEPRAPAFDCHQLDEMIKEGLWGPLSWGSDDVDLPPDELRLWTTVKLFIGYFATMHNLSTTFVQGSDLATTSLLGCISVEYIYAISFQLQKYYNAFILLQREHVALSKTSRTVPAVILYAHEVIHRLMVSMRQTDWKLSDNSQQHPLHQLQTNFNERVEHVLRYTSMLECQDSGRFVKNRRTQCPPAMIEFVRSLPTTKFPSCCIMTASRQTQRVSCSVPCSWEPGNRYRSLDIVGAQDGDMLPRFCSLDFDGMPTVQDFVSDKNTIVGFDSSLRQRSTYSKQPAQTVTDVYSGTESVGSIISEASSVSEPVQQSHEMDCEMLRMPHPEVYLKAGPGNSPPPSLMSGSPLSAFSPVTPTSFIADPEDQSFTDLYPD